MIKSEDGVVAVRGTRVDLLYDLAMAMKALLNKEVADEEMIIACLSYAVMESGRGKECTERLENEVGEMVKQTIINKIDEMDDIGTALNLLGMLINEK